MFARVKALSVLAVLATYWFAGSGHAQTQSWTGNVSSAWSEAGNWSPGPAPNGVSAAAQITPDLASDLTILLDRPAILNSLTLGDATAANGYRSVTVAPAGASNLTFPVSSAGTQPTVSSSNGANRLTAGLAVDNASLTVTTSGGSLRVDSLSLTRGGVVNFAATGTSVGSGLGATNGIAPVAATFGSTNARDWAAYDGATGAVTAFAGYTTDNNTLTAGIQSTDNRQVTGTLNVTVSAAATLNSLVWRASVSGQKLTLAADLTLVSGGFMRASTANQNVVVDGTGTLRTPAGVPLVVHNINNNQVTIAAPLDVTGITVNSGNRVVLSNAANNFRGGDINVVQGTLRFAYDPTSLTGAMAVSAAGVLDFGAPGNPNRTITVGGSATVNGNVVSTGANGANQPALTFAGSLRGTGTIQASIPTVNVSGTVAPGEIATGVGRLTVGGNLSVTSTGTIAVRIGSTTSDNVAFTTHDSLGVGADLALPAGAKLQVSSTVAGFTPGLTTNYTIATATSVNGLNSGSETLGTYLVGGSSTGPVVIDPQGFASGDQFTLRRVNGSIILSYSPVPEPTAVVATVIGGAGAYSVYRRRTRGRRRSWWGRLFGLGRIRYPEGSPEKMFGLPAPTTRRR